MKKKGYKAALICLLAALLLTYGGSARAEGAILEGDLKLTGAETEISVAACLRVDVKQAAQDGAWAELTLPGVPNSIVDVLLFDGWHAVHAKWAYLGNSALRLCFRPDDLLRLDGTVGIYLVILTK